VYAGCYTTARHHDAFFIREDLIDSSHIPSLDSFSDIHVPLHAVCVSGRENIYLDYSVWLETKDLEKSRSAVPNEWKKHITGSFFQRLRRKQKMLMHKLGFSQ